MLVSAITVLAQESIQVQAPNVVAADEQFNVTFVIEGENSPSDFQWSPGSDFQLVWGPQKGSSTSITIINGKRTRTSQSTYTYVLLPKSTGTFTLQEAEATVKGENIKSRRVSIEVVSNGASSRSQQSSGSSSSSSSSSKSSSGEIDSEDLFLRLTLSRTNVVVGEPLTATLKLYQRVNIAGFEDARFPSFNGFWNQEVQAPTNIDFQRESLGDKIYNSAVLRSWTLIPQQAGDIVIDPAELVCLVNVRVATTPMSIFDSFFQDDYRTIRKKVVSASPTVHVAKLPAGAPSSFGGGVGTYSIKAQVSKDSLKTHDAASLVVTISGRGNVSLLEAPKVNFPPDFEVYDTKITDATDKGSKTSGSKSFEYPFIPRSHGEFTIPPIEYSYYDVSAGKYVTLSTDPIEIRVARGNETEPASTGIVSSGTIRKDVRSLGSDIRFISTKLPSLSRKGAFMVFSTGFWIALCLLLAAAAACYFVLRSLASRRADVVGTKNRQATKMARKRLSAAGGYLQNNLYTAFYEELHRALLGFISDKCNIDSADMSKERISESLQAGGVSAELSDSFISLLDACEFARYAPDAGHEAMNAHYESAVSVISSIDSSMKKKSSPSVRGTAVVVALLMLLPVSGHAAARDAYLDSLWVSGANAYADGSWETALDSWNSIAALGVESPELYYNIGNAFFKSQDYSHAILNYERALKLDPSYSDARFNLEYANEFIQDKIDVVPEFFLEAWGRKVCWLMPSDTWTILFFIFLALTLACLLVFLLSGGRTSRRVAFFSGIVALVLSLLCLDFAQWQWSDYRQADKAIVVRPVTSVKSSPGTDSSKDLFILHEGTKVTITDKVGSWLNVELSDGRQGWIPADDIEII